MGKTEAKVDLWINDLLKEADISLEPQGSSIKEIENALKTASKKGTGNVGRPDFIGVVKDFVLIIEDKSDISKHERLNNERGISTDSKDIIEYAINGALFYARHIVKNTTYKKVIAFGVSGNAKRHKITPLYVEDTELYTRLEDVESFISFNESNIDEYYTRSILHEDTSEKDLKTVLKNATELHEHLRIHGSLGTREKPIVVSGILLALDEIDKENFKIKSLTGDKVKTDGQKIFDAITSKLERDSVRPEKKKDKILAQFNIFKTSEILNTVNASLNKTPLRYFC